MRLLFKFAQPAKNADSTVHTACLSLVFAASVPFARYLVCKPLILIRSLWIPRGSLQEPCTLFVVLEEFAHYNTVIEQHVDYWPQCSIACREQRVQREDIFAPCANGRKRRRIKAPTAKERRLAALRSRTGRSRMVQTTRTNALPATAPPPTEDRRIVRSKKALRDAFIELMEERGLEGFTVNDLCARADLNRGTFYNHFHGKEDCLKAFEDEIMEDLDRYRERMQHISLPEVLRCRVRKQPMPLLVELFDYLRAQGDFLHAVLGPGGDVRFGPRLREAVCTNLIYSVLHERYRRDPSPFVGYYTAFFASAYLGVIERWVETGMQESSEEMARIAVRLLFIKPGEAITL